VWGAGGCLDTLSYSPAQNAFKVPVSHGLSMPTPGGVGDANDMMGCYCGGHPCAWDNNGPVTVEPREFVIELSDLAGWISDARKVFEQDLFLGKGRDINT
jgi:hypothetical protein